LLIDLHDGGKRWLVHPLQDKAEKPYVFLSGQNPRQNFKKDPALEPDFAVMDFNNVTKNSYAKALLEMFDCSKHFFDEDFFKMIPHQDESKDPFHDSYVEFLRRYTERSSSIKANNAGTVHKRNTFNRFFMEGEDILLNAMNVGSMFVDQVKAILHGVPGDTIKAVHMFVHSRLDICTLCSRKLAAISKLMNSGKLVKLLRDDNILNRTTEIPFVLMTSSTDKIMNATFMDLMKFVDSPPK
jgi:hypothetical protein